MIILFLLIVVAILVGVVYFFYALPKALGFPNVGVFLSLVVAVLIVCVIAFSIVYDPDDYFTIEDARVLLKNKEGIKLQDDFTLVSYESSYGLHSFSEELTVDISDSDKARLIGTLFHEGTYNVGDIIDHEHYREEIDILGGDYVFTRNYNSSNRYVIIYLSKDGNRLFYDRLK